MRHLTVALLCLVVAAPVLADAPAKKEYSKLDSGHETCQTAVSFDAPSETDGVAKEYEWIKANYPSYHLVEQKLIDCQGKPTDAMAIADGNKRTFTYVLFDLSKFFGKGW